MRINAKTDIGVRRKDNQDNFWSARLEVNGKEAGIVCVCDGMGGLNDGGLASKIVVKAVRDHLIKTFNLQTLPDILSEVNKEIFDRNNRMGTTCTVLICYEGSYTIFHVGDSRCYLVRDGQALALTTDHSALVKYNITKAKNPELWKKYKSILTRCIGVTEEVEVDVLGGEYVDGDSFFVCSDGLWHYIEDSGVAVEDLNDLGGLIQRCILSGETDNISVGVLNL